jgi:predicted short-subunit dehydrogenase-like oxidoreductase (DUF2520 family)
MTGSPIPTARTVVVLGQGRVGRSLTGALHTAGQPVRLESARGWRARRGQGWPEESLHGLVVLAVPDRVLLPLVQEIAADPPSAAVAFVHLSGALELEVLAPLAERGCAVGSFHPLQPFPAERPPQAFRDSLVTVDASTPELLKELEGLARMIGARPLHVSRGRRSLYHAGAVMAANLTVALAAQAESVFEAVGWRKEEARAAVLSLMRGALETMAEVGLPGGLSGPVQRGEVDTVVGHLAALETVPSSETLAKPVDVYRTLSLAALDLAAANGLDTTLTARLASILADRVDGQGG